MAVRKDLIIERGATFLISLIATELVYIQAPPTSSVGCSCKSNTPAIRCERAVADLTGLSVMMQIREESSSEDVLLDLTEEDISVLGMLN